MAIEATAGTGGGGGGLEDEQFYESADRIASSSCPCSTSHSESDLELLHNSCSSNSNSRSPSPALDPKLNISNYDMWASEPGPVSERRQRLLRQMGLSSDISFFRSQQPNKDVNFISSVSCDFLTPQRLLGPRDDGVTRSKSDGPSGGSSDKYNDDYDSCSSSSSFPWVLVYSPSILYDDSINVHRCNCNGNGNSKRQVADNKNSIKKNGYVVGGIERANLPSLQSSATICVVSPNTPSCEHGRIVDRGRVRSNSNGFVEGLESNVKDNGSGELADVCTIKNLDTGKQFVVDEIKEDGMWNKLKEVGTGRQLTMEEFEMTLGRSPIVQELMKRQNGVAGTRENHDSDPVGGTETGRLDLKKKTSWLRSIRSIAKSIKGHKERMNDERDARSERGGRRSSSGNDESLDVFQGPKKVRVKQYGKSYKDLTALYKTQEIQAHSGSVWSIKFSLDGRYLASAGEDCLVHVRQVVETVKKGESVLGKSEVRSLNWLIAVNGSPEPIFLSSSADGDAVRRGRSSISRKSLSLEHIVRPETVFALTDKPICSFEGHLADVLDLSWSKSQLLLSSSMDKTVRLWHLSSKTCLKIFSHRDYVTCIQFNPVDDRFFLSGSLDGKVRIWSIPDGQVVDWNDLHEMITAACYTPDGQGALVGSYKGSCRLYSTAENKLQQKCEINLEKKRKKSNYKKITGFQFVPGSSSEVLVTSADSRIRVIDHIDLVHKFKGFRNTNSHFTASLTSNAKFVVSASEGSNVYIWKHEANWRLTRDKVVTVTQSYEHFRCQDVSAAIPWLGTSCTGAVPETCSGFRYGQDNHLDEVSITNHPLIPFQEVLTGDLSPSLSGCTNRPHNQIISGPASGRIYERISATCPQEKLNLDAGTRRPQTTSHVTDEFTNQRMSAYGMVIVTAGLRGQINAYQNFGLPVPT
ncbi:unnamed protein product [Linum trigynum]|uniref:WD repeat-containing protein 44-like n=1 Tax=Linum trigynum TaxID=586398 RepID=A0AAV2D1D8_9ROSI